MSCDRFELITHIEKPDPPMAAASPLPMSYCYALIPLSRFGTVLEILDHRCLTLVTNDRGNLVGSDLSVSAADVNKASSAISITALKTSASNTRRGVP